MYLVVLWSLRVWTYRQSISGMRYWVTHYYLRVRLYTRRSRKWWRRLRRYISYTRFSFRRFFTSTPVLSDQTDRVDDGHRAWCGLRRHHRISTYVKNIPQYKCFVVRKYIPETGHGRTPGKNIYILVRTGFVYECIHPPVRFQRFGRRTPTSRHHVPITRYLVNFVTAYTPIIIVCYV